jgi:flagellin-like protein
MKWNRDEEGVSPVIAIILMVAITVVLAGVLYVWVTSLADTTETVDNLQMTANLEVAGGNAYLNITHGGGPKVTWSDYRVTLDGLQVQPAAPETSVGERAEFVQTGTSIAVDDVIEVKIIDIDDEKIVWSDLEVRAKTG